MTDESLTSKAATLQVNRLIKANRINRIVIAVLGMVTVISLAASIVTGVNTYRTNQLATKVQQGAVSSCVAGNSRAAADKSHWNLFINALINNPSVPKTRQALENKVMSLNLDPNTTTAVLAIIDTNWSSNKDNVELAQKIESSIDKSDAPRNCSQIYSVRAEQKAAEG